MQTHANKAFTLVEIMIVVTLIGLLAAMAIPAFQRVKTGEIAKEVIAGHVISDYQMQYLKDHITLLPTNVLLQLPTTAHPSNNIYNAPVESFQLVVINGTTYKLVPQ